MLCAWATGRIYATNAAAGTYTNPVEGLCCCPPLSFELWNRVKTFRFIAGEFISNIADHTFGIGLTLAGARHGQAF